MNNEFELSIVVPCFNEARSIPMLVERFIESAPQGMRAELVLVDNGSWDGTMEIMKKIAATHDFLNIVRIEKNAGYGHGILKGLKAAGGEFLAYTHADLQTDIGDAFRAYAIMEKSDQPTRTFIKGNRIRRPIFDAFFTLGMSVFETIVLGTLLTEINAQPTLFHRCFFESLQNPPPDFSFDLYLYLIAKKRKMRVERIDVDFKKRVHGESHWNTSFSQKMKFIRRTVEFTMKLRKRLKDEK